jgi:LmbE family N-acetylglucosaminyl deacetylase
MDVGAHEDDALLFMSPDLAHDVQAGKCVRSVVVTAGDNGMNQTYWHNRELGLEAALANMAGVANVWTDSDAGIAGHPMVLATLNAAPSVSVVFMRLPDGNLNGDGFVTTGFSSLQKLWTEALPSLTPVDNTASYTRQGLIDTLTQLMAGSKATTIQTQDYVGAFGDGDHSDHYGTGYFTRAAHQNYTTKHTLVGYQGYGTQTRPANVTGADLTAKQNAFFIYTPFDTNTCQTFDTCTGPIDDWLARQYTVGSETAGTIPARSGYWMVGTDGTVYPFGDAAQYGKAPDGVHIESTPSGFGYWVVDAAGSVFAFGDAPYLGGLGGALHPFEAVTSLSSTPSGHGYWLFTTLGRVVPFGDATFHGDMSGTRLNGPVLGSIATPSGNGYYMVASDGGIFAFGDAQFYGSMGGKPLNAPVTSLVPDGDGVGYWLVASDGGIFAFQAAFQGSVPGALAPGQKLNKPIIGAVANGAGYLMVASDGGIFAFGTDFHGSLGGNPPSHPITSVAAVPS